MIIPNQELTFSLPLSTLDVDRVLEAASSP